MGHSLEVRDDEEDMVKLLTEMKQDREDAEVEMLAAIAIVGLVAWFFW